VRLAALILISLVLSAGVAPAETIMVASTTSTENSGLFDYIFPMFREKTGIEVRAVAVGTGQAIRMARRGDADVLFVHDRASEEAFVAGGFGLARYEVMYNDFIVVGPRQDPAKIRGLKDVAAALQQIAKAKAPFTSRGDDSGTHKAELRLWKASGLDPRPASGSWYLETGQGQGSTLNVASGMGAYMFVDRGTWISFKNRGDLEMLVEGDPLLFNQYGVIVVNPKKHPHVKAKAGQAFVDWLVSPEGQKAIGDFRIEGQPLFTPNAKSD
jgi:tungstate transport system substrate-binding protein